MPSGVLMSATKVRWLSLALQDMDGIAAYLEEHEDRETALRVVDAIWQVGQSLKVLPGRGRHGRVPGTRELVLPRLSYYLAYRVRDDEVQILRVIHTARNIDVNTESDGYAQ